MEDGIKIEFDQRIEDHLRFNLWRIRTLDKTKLFAWLFRPLLAITILIMFLSMLLTGPGDVVQIIPLMLMIIIAIPIFMPAIGLHLINAQIAKRAIKKAFATDPTLQSSVTFRFSDSGAEVVTPLAQITNLWTAYKQAFETETDFYLSLSEANYTILPKRCFKDEEQITAFRKMLDRNLKRKPSR